MAKELWEQKDEVLRQYYDLFAGRPDVYAIRFERSDGNEAWMDDDVIYQPSNRPGKTVLSVVDSIGTDEYHEDVIEAHLEGKELIGIYPIWPDSTVRLFAFDIDGKVGDPWEYTKRQAKILEEEAGLKVYLERSQSGNGFHIWGFLEEPVNAGVIRHALAHFIEKSEVFDRMYPVQPALDPEKTYGNLIALPLSGKRRKQGNSCFVEIGEDGSPILVENQFKYLFEMEYNSIEKVRELFDNAPEEYVEPELRERLVDPEALKGSYKLVDDRFGCEFILDAYDEAETLPEDLWYALACQFAQLEDGRELFHEWSAQDPHRYDFATTDKKFDQALRANKPHTCETIRTMGGECYCDERFPDRVSHPYDLVKIPFLELAAGIEEDEEAEDTVTPAYKGLLQAADWAEQVEKDPTIGKGYPYGIRSIDEHTGIRDGDLLVWGGRPGMGKSAFMLQVAHNLADQGIPVYIFSVEMTEEQLYRRLLSVITGVSQQRLRRGMLTGSDWKKISECLIKIKDEESYPLFVNDKTRNVSKICEISADLIYDQGTGEGVVFIDYLQLLQRLPRESSYDHVSRVTEELRLMAKTLDIPVFSLAQLNRGADEVDTDGQTFDSWLKGSGDLEQSAAFVGFILGEKGPGVKLRTVVHHKDRFGEAGIKSELEFNQTLMQFADPGTWVHAPPHMGNEHIVLNKDVPTVGEDDDEEWIDEDEQDPWVGLATPVATED